MLMFIYCIDREVDIYMYAMVVDNNGSLLSFVCHVLRTEMLLESCKQSNTSTSSNEAHMAVVPSPPNTIIVQV